MLRTKMFSGNLCCDTAASFSSNKQDTFQIAFQTQFQKHFSIAWEGKKFEKSRDYISTLAKLYKNSISHLANEFYSICSPRLLTSQQPRGCAEVGQLYPGPRGQVCGVGAPPFPSCAPLLFPTHPSPSHILKPHIFYRVWNVSQTQRCYKESNASTSGDSQ